MKKWAVGLLAVLAAGALAAEAPRVRELPWAQLKEEGWLKGGQPEGTDAYVFQNAEAKAATLPALAIDRPGVAARHFAISGQVRHEGVEGTVDGDPAGAMADPAETLRAGRTPEDQGDGCVK